MRIGKGKAIGKIILMGEHAVVYGEPAIAIPFPSTRITTTIEETVGEVKLNCYCYKGLLKNAPDKLLGLKTVIEKILEEFNRPLKNFNIDIKSTIPPERGMGSSAAVAIATTRALFNYFEKYLSLEELEKYSSISEKIVHGNPSGLDAAIIMEEESLYYIKGESFEPFHINLDGYLLVADTGEKGGTKEAVSDVKKILDRHSGKILLINQLGEFTKQAKEYLENNQPIELGQLMTKAHEILDQLTVSNPTLNKLVKVSLENNSLGAKLTGGGRGGAMISLCPTREAAENISKKLLENGAKNTWIAYLGDEFNES